MAIAPRDDSAYEEVTNAYEGVLLEFFAEPHEVVEDNAERYDKCINKDVQLRHMRHDLP